MIHHCNCQAFIILVLFTVPFYHFLFSRYLGLTKRHFSSDILVPFPDLSDLYNLDVQRQHLVIFFVSFGSFFCDLSTKPFILCFAGFQKYQKIFNQKIYQRERCDSNKCFVFLSTCLYKKANHLSLNNHFVPLLKLLMSTENKLKRKHENSHREKVGTGSLCQKCKRKWITFF